MWHEPLNAVDYVAGKEPCPLDPHDGSKPRRPRPLIQRTMVAVEDKHVRGLELSRLFYRDAVEPLLRRHFGRVTHTAALIGTGSEVLGFDTERSADHDWGPRLQLFLGPDDADRHGEAITAMLAERLP